MASDVDINATRPDGLPIIFQYISREDIARIEAYIAAAGDLEAEGYHGATPVLTAAIVDNWPVVLLFLRAGANPNPADDRGFTLPYRTATSRVVPDGRYGAALAEVRAFLNERGLLEQVYDRGQVQQMRDEGRWPPR